MAAAGFLESDSCGMHDAYLRHGKIIKYAVSMLGGTGCSYDGATIPGALLAQPNGAVDDLITTIVHE